MNAELNNESPNLDKAARFLVSALVSEPITDQQRALLLHREGALIGAGILEGKTQASAYQAIANDRTEKHRGVVIFFYL